MDEGEKDMVKSPALARLTMSAALAMSVTLGGCSLGGEDVPVEALPLENVTPSASINYVSVPEIPLPPGMQKTACLGKETQHWCLRSALDPDLSVDQLTDNLIGVGYLPQSMPEQDPESTYAAAFLVGVDNTELLILAKPSDPGTMLTVSASKAPTAATVGSVQYIPVPDLPLPPNARVKDCHPAGARRTCFHSPKKPEDSIKQLTDKLITAGYRSNLQPNRESADSYVSAFFFGPDGVELSVAARPAGAGADLMVGASRRPE